MITDILGIGTKIIDKVFVTDEEKAAARVRLIEAEQAGELKSAEMQMRAIVAEAGSEDKVVRRARPFFIWLFGGLVALNVLVALAGAVFDPDLAMRYSTALKLLLGAIPQEMWTTFTLGYLGYVGGRSWDKTQKLKAGR